MIDVFSKLKTDIDVERRAMEKIWKRREKELERATLSTTMMLKETDCAWALEASKLWKIGFAPMPISPMVLETQK